MASIVTLTKLIQLKAQSDVTVFTTNQNTPAKTNLRSGGRNLPGLPKSL